MKIEIGKKYRMLDHQCFEHYKYFLVLSYDEKLDRYNGRSVTGQFREYKDWLSREALLNEFEPLVTKVKSTELSRFMYPEAQEEDGWLIIEG